ncbi:MAG TPA: sigma-70 family RNA polymerase sigma factor [Polyangiaceae bacterium]
MPSDWELLQSWREGDRQAGDALVGRYLGAIRRFFRHKLESGEDDLVQRTFVACVEAAARFEARSSFRTFLYAIARNVLLDHLRAVHRDSLRGPGEFDPSVSSLCAFDTSPSQALAGKESAARLLRALRSVPLDAQLLLELYYWEELSVAELAEVLVLPEGTIKGRLHRARQALHERMAKDVAAALGDAEGDPGALFGSLRPRIFE